MPQKLISELFERWAGKPILVLAGGPSVLTDLPRVKTAPACVISANEHGVRQKMFPVDLIVNMDNNHVLKKTPMESILRPLGVPIVNRYSWADYRLCDWQFAGNTGIAAVALAAALGGNPIMVTGIDLWAGNRRYFYSLPSKVRHHTHRVHPAIMRRSNKQRAKKLIDFCRGANVRPMSGPLCEFFDRYDPAEVLPGTRPIRYRRELQDMQPVYVQSSGRFRLTSLDMVPSGRTVVLSPKEAARAPFGSRCHKVAPPL